MHQSTKYPRGAPGPLTTYWCPRVGTFDRNALPHPGAIWTFLVINYCGIWAQGGAFDRLMPPQGGALWFFFSVKCQSPQFNIASYTYLYVVHTYLYVGWSTYKGTTYSYDPYAGGTKALKCIYNNICNIGGFVLANFCFRKNDGSHNVHRTISEHCKYWREKIENLYWCLQFFENATRYISYSSISTKFLYIKKLIFGALEVNKPC